MQSKARQPYNEKVQSGTSQCQCVGHEHENAHVVCAIGQGGVPSSEPKNISAAPEYSQSRLPNLKSKSLKGPFRSSIDARLRRNPLSGRCTQRCSGGQDGPQAKRWGCCVEKAGKNRSP